MGKVMTRPRVKGLAAGTSRVYHVRVPNELADAWDTFLEKNDEKSQEVLRRVMAQLVNKAKPKPKVPAQDFLEPAVMDIAKHVDVAPKKAVKLLLTQDEHAVLTAIADQRECSLQWWIISLVRAALTRGITVGGAELKALGASNYQLMAIGRNLNQIAHQINADPGRHHLITSRMIDALSDKLVEHRKQVGALVSACSHRWKLTD